MKSSHIVGSASSLLEAALLVPLLVDGAAPSQRLFAYAQALCHPWLSPTREVLKRALFRLQGIGAITIAADRTAACPQPARAYLTRCLTAALVDNVGHYSALAQLLVGTAHPALSTESVGALRAEIADAQAVWVTPGLPSPTNTELSCLERARCYRVAVAGAQLGVLNAFLMRVPSLSLSLPPGPGPVEAG
jgi:hypothetical protein